MPTKTPKKPVAKSLRRTSLTRSLVGDDTRRVYLVSMPVKGFSTARVAGNGVFCRVNAKRQDLSEQFRAARDRSVWIASESSALTWLTKRAPVAKHDRRLLVLNAMKEVSHHLYSAYFRYVVTASDSLRFLPFEELAEVFASPNRDNLFIGGAFDREGDAILLYRGNIEPLVVPRAWFTNRASNAVVDPDAVQIVDYGQTVKLGEFEASADAILYEFDSEYRRAARKRALEKDPSLGASIRRLRLQRGLSRSAFPGVTAKAIARLERNETSKPHARTLETIASTLGVSTSALWSY